MSPSEPVRSPLLDRTYRQLFAAQVIALIGTGLSTVALALLAYDLAGGDAGMVLGTALALKMVAYVFVAPFVGAFANRLARRRLLISLDLSRAALVACLPFVSSIWQIYLLIFLLNACSAAFTPTFQATIPDVLTDERQYTRALSLSRLAYDLENLLSPTLAALALLIITYSGLFVVNALAFSISALLILSVRLPRASDTEDRIGFIESLTFGSRVFFATPRLRALLALYLSVACAGAMVIVNTVVYVRERLGGSDNDTALVLAAAGGGSMVVALLLPKALDQYPDRHFMLAGGAILGLGLLLGVLQPGFTWLLLVWFLLGAGSSLVQTPAGRIILRSCHVADRPALFAAQFTLSHACWLVAYPLAGWLSGLAGLTVAFVTLGIMASGSALLAWRLWRWPDPTRLHHIHEPMMHDHPHEHDLHHQHHHGDGLPHAGGATAHWHAHRHDSLEHEHDYVIDRHHPRWPRQ